MGINPTGTPAAFGWQASYLMVSLITDPNPMSSTLKFVNMSQNLTLEQQLQLLIDLQGTGREYSSAIAEEIILVQEKLRIKRMLAAEVRNDATVGSTEYATMCSVCCEYNCTDTHQDYIDSMEAGAGRLKGPDCPVCFESNCGDRNCAAIIAKEDEGPVQDLDLDMGFVIRPSPGDHITVFPNMGKSFEIDALVVRQLPDHKLVVFAQDRLSIVEAALPLESSEFYIVRSLDVINLYQDYL
jgi:hypothetical protein